MPPKKQTTPNAGRFDRLPAELVRRCADFSDAPAALNLHEACNKKRAASPSPWPSRTRMN